MTTIKAILVDDEESARDVLENLLKRFCPQIELCGKYTNVPEAVEAISRISPQVVFLDIEMPNYTGYEIVNFFKHITFEIIFITAYDKYALRAFEIAAVDYLLKPIDIERLKEAVSRVKTAIDFKHNAEKLNLLGSTLQNKEIKNILISEKGYQQLIALDSVIAIEAQESYCYIHTHEKRYTVSKNLKHYETILFENKNFIRVHKSWFISRKHILSYSKTELSIQLTKGLSAKLSKYKKAEFEDFLLH
jgi:two-component system LytT family response regulator